MKRTLIVIGVLWLVYLGIVVSDSDVHASGGLIKGLFIAGAGVVLVLVASGLRGAWRAARRVNVETVARTAGALTGKVEERAASLSQAFKDGRGR
jgi:hypothetical protein